MKNAPVKIPFDTQDTYMPEVGTVDEAECGVCGAKMTVRRDQYGPTNFVSAMAKSNRNYDYFECPHRKEKWHEKVVSIRRYMKDVPSDTLCEIMKQEVDQILREAWEAAKGLDTSGGMWLLPAMQADADRLQEQWDGHA